ncbi:MAG: hypothetical protein R3D34_04900 [Nitratireductor sp.]
MIDFENPVTTSPAFLAIPNAPSAARSIAASVSAPTVAEMANSPFERPVEQTFLHHLARSTLLRLAAPRFPDPADCA